jgi:hypothetical protein
MKCVHDRHRSTEATTLHPAPGAVGGAELCQRGCCGVCGGGGGCSRCTTVAALSPPASASQRPQPENATPFTFCVWYPDSCAIRAQRAGSSAWLLSSTLAVYAPPHTHATSGQAQLSPGAAHVTRTSCGWERRERCCAPCRRSPERVAPPPRRKPARTQSSRVGR